MRMPSQPAARQMVNIRAMPFKKNTYVRYWDGHAVGYGKIVEVNEDGTYDVRVGGTTMIRVVREGDISIHPVHVASGKKMDTWVIFERVDVTGQWLYHGTSFSLLPSIVISKGLIPRSNVDWVNLDVGWKGADSNRGVSPVVDLGEEYQKQRELYVTAHGEKYEPLLEQTYRKRLMGDPGEFVYASKLPGTVASYLLDINKKKEKTVVFRFKSTKAWYRDPNQGSAVISNMMITLEDLQAKYVSGTDIFFGEEYIIGVIEDEEGWIACKNPTWRTQIEKAASVDNTV